MVCQFEVETGGKLHGAQNAQRVFGKGGRDMAQHALIKVFPAAVEIQQFASQGIEHHGVDREIAPAAGLIRIKMRIKLHIKATVSGACFFLPARQKHLY